MKKRMKVVVKRNFNEVMEVNRKDEEFLRSLIFYMIDSLADGEDVRLSTRLSYDDDEEPIEDRVATDLGDLG